MLRHLAIASVCIAVAGCVDTAARPQSIVIDPNVAPGTQEVTSTVAAQEFGRVCVDNAPGFANAPAQLRSPTYERSSTTGTYFHQALNLSVKLPTDTPFGTVCSMVFGSNENPAALARALGNRSGATDLILSPSGTNLSAMGTAGTRVTLRSSGNKSSGHRLYNVFLRRPAEIPQ